MRTVQLLGHDAYNCTITSAWRVQLYNYGSNQGCWWPIRYKNFDIVMIIIIIIIIMIKNNHYVVHDQRVCLNRFLFKQNNPMEVHVYTVLSTIRPEFIHFRFKFLNAFFSCNVLATYYWFILWYYFSITETCHKMISIEHKSEILRVQMPRTV